MIPVILQNVLVRGYIFWLGIKRCKLVHSCIAYTATCTKTQTVSRVTSHVTTKQRWKRITSVHIRNALCQATVRVAHDKSAVGLLGSRE